MKRNAPHIDTLLESLEGETWESVFGYDGVYEVSNFGRIKGLRRYAGKRLIKEKVMKQTIGTDGSLRLSLSMDGVKKTVLVPVIVANAFLRDRADGECVIHINKIKTDNRVENLKIGTYSESSKLNYALGVQVDWGISTLSVDNRKQYERENVTRGETEDQDMIICPKCGFEKAASYFYLRQESSFRRRICKACYQSNLGVREIGKIADRIELAQNGLRYCSMCKELKSLDVDFCKSKKSFMGRSNICRPCQKVLNDKNNPRRGLKMKLISIGPDSAVWNPSDCPDNFYENDTTRSPANLS